MAFDMDLIFYSCIFQENTCFKYLFSHLCKYPPVNTSTTCPLYCNPHCCVLNIKSTALAREVSFPMRSAAEAATQTLTAVILFLKSRSSVSFFLSIFVCDRLFLYFFTDLVCYWGSEFISFPAHCYGNPSRKPNTVFLSKSGNCAALCSWIMKWWLSQEAGRRPQALKTNW